MHLLSASVSQGYEMLPLSVQSAIACDVVDVQMSQPEAPYTALTSGRRIYFNPKYITSPVQAAVVWLHEWRHVQQGIQQMWRIPPYTIDGTLGRSWRREVDSYIYALQWSIHISPEVNRIAVEYYNSYMLALVRANVDLQLLWLINP